MVQKMANVAQFPLGHGGRLAVLAFLRDLTDKGQIHGWQLAPEKDDEMHIGISFRIVSEGTLALFKWLP